MAKKRSVQILRKTIYTIAHKLGAHVDVHRAVPQKLGGCPAFIVEFHSIVWPKRREYDAPQFSRNPNDPPRGLFAVNFPGSLQRTCAGQVTGADDKDLFLFGTHGGGNWLLALDGNDENKANPMVYEIDHEPGCRIRELCRLMQLLKQLQPE